MADSNLEIPQCAVILTTNRRKNLSNVGVEASLRFFATLRMTVYCTIVDGVPLRLGC
jgi:hypothetical protein